MMGRNIAHKAFSALLAVWYLAAVFGFDVHSSCSGRTYLTFLFNGISCERIHPDCPCHHHGHESCEDDEDCCSDTFWMLSFNGYDDSRRIDVSSWTGQGFTAVCRQPVCLCQPCATSHVLVPVPPGPPPLPSIHCLCVMRS